MGRSPSSCFKIMACAGDSANNSDVSPPPESKASADKRRWSFRKRSSRYHVPNNNAISETQSIGKKEDQEAAHINVNSEKASTSQKATVAEQTDETASLPSAVLVTREPDQVTDKSIAQVDYSIHEDVVVVAQASIRGYMAKRELVKLRNVVKLQAVVRGYLVRRQAVGTLRCILAILKIQQLVRARHSMKLTAKEKLYEKNTAEMVRNSDMKLSKTPPAIRKLVSNAFSGQLLQSSLKTKPIYISCNHLRPDLGWIWLERWMALTSLVQQKIMLNQVDMGKDMSTDLSNCQVNELQVTPEHKSSDSNLTSSDSAVPPENEEHSITNSPQRREFEDPASAVDQYSNPHPQDDQLERHGDEPLSVEKDEWKTSAWIEESSHSVYTQNLLSSDAGSLFEFNVNANEPDYAEEKPINTARYELQETSETEVGHVLNGFRKPRNAAFAAVQAKFEELSSTSNSNRSLGHESKDATAESKLLHSQMDSKSAEINQTQSVYFHTGPRFNEVSLTENVGNQYPVTRGDTLEGGPEFLTTCMVDRSETEIVSEIRTSEGKHLRLGSDTNHEFNIRDIKAESNGLSCESDAIHQKIMARSSEKVAISFNTANTVPLEQQSAERATSNIQVEETAKDPPVEVKSQAGSPSNLVTVTGSRGTPSSEISIHAKTTKVENNFPVKKQKSQLVFNSSPTDSKNDSGARTSGEHSQKDTKTVKRRNSPLMARTDHGDHEHGTGSSNILPSYMQPTESARAKVNSSISQKSSPDLHEKNTNPKKRHSLPTGDGKQGSSSPRMQRSTSQAQQNSKANGTYSPQNSTGVKFSC